MSQMENKTGINAVLASLTGTVSLLDTFINQTKENLPQEQKDLLDKEFKKAQKDLSKVMGDINNIKI